MWGPRWSRSARWSSSSRSSCSARVACSPATRHGGCEVAARAQPASTRTAGRRGLFQQTLVRHLAVAVAAGLLLLVLTSAVGPFADLQLATMAYLFIAVAGLTVLTGLNGQISLGHGALMAVGAYTTAKVLGDSGTGPPLVVALVAATVAAAVAGLLAGAAGPPPGGPHPAGGGGPPRA